MNFLLVCGSVITINSDICLHRIIWIKFGLSSYRKAPSISTTTMSWPSFALMTEMIKTNSRWTVGAVVSPFGVYPCCLCSLAQWNPHHCLFSVLWWSWSIPKQLSAGPLWVPVLWSVSWCLWCVAVSALSLLLVGLNCQTILHWPFMNIRFWQCLEYDIFLSHYSCSFWWLQKAGLGLLLIHDLVLGFGSGWIHDDCFSCAWVCSYWCGCMSCPSLVVVSSKGAVVHLSTKY